MSIPWTSSHLIQKKHNTITYMHASLPAKVSYGHQQI